MKQVLAAVIALFLCAPAVAEPLAGKIWDARSAEFIAFPDMVKVVAESRFIIIGETHGREAHQSREAFLIGALVESGRAPAVVLEMLSTTQTVLVSLYRLRQPEYAMELALSLDWANSNWPDWSFYYPVFNMAFTAKLPILGGDLPDGSAGKVTQDQEIRSLEYYRDGMLRAHCGLIDEARALELARTQMARDNSMADTLLAADDGVNGAILIVGASHVRHSTGVPAVLGVSDTVVILLAETDATSERFLESADEVLGQPAGEFDFIWFTPKLDETSFCDRIGG